MKNRIIFTISFFFYIIDLSAQASDLHFDLMRFETGNPGSGNYPVLIAKDTCINNLRFSTNGLLGQGPTHFTTDPVQPLQSVTIMV